MGPDDRTEGFVSIGAERSVTNFGSICESTLGCFMLPVRTLLVSITAAKLICKGKDVSFFLREGNTGRTEVESDHLHPIAAPKQQPFRSKNFA